MGSDQSWARDKEKAINSMFNGFPSDDMYDNNIVNYIQQYYNMKYGEKIVGAVWNGRSGVNEKPGDIIVTLESGAVKTIEMKMSFSNLSGTIKNPGNKFFNIISEGAIKDYSTFEEALCEKRHKLLAEYLGCNIPNQCRFVKLLRGVRNKASKGCKKSKKLIEKIKEITEPGQTDYGNYVVENIAAYFPKLNEYISNTIFHINDNNQCVDFVVVKNYSSKNQTVSFYDYSTMNIKAVSVTSDGKTIFMFNSDNELIVRFSINWKNVCQGGGTPSFNVFVGNAFKVKSSDIFKLTSN